jgi:hypothetical protein
MALPSFRTVDPGRERLVRLSFEDCHETAPLPGCGEGLTSGRVWSREDWFISTTQRFPGPPSIMFTAEETRLRIGVDRRHRIQNSSSIGRWSTPTIVSGAMHQAQPQATDSPTEPGAAAALEDEAVDDFVAVTARP